jgi:hypothetical protein
MVTCALPKTALSLSSALMLRLLDLSCKLCFLMKTYEVYAYCDLPSLKELEAIGE